MLVFREEQPEEDSVQNDCSDISEPDTQPADNESSPEHEANYETEESMQVVLDNYDNPVIHTDDNNEALMVDF